MSSFETVDFASAGAIATITLNRPKSLNAFDTQLRHDLLAAVKKANEDDSIRVVIVTGAGRGFSAGADLQKGMSGFDKVGEMIVKEFKPIFVAIDEADKIYIAAVNGPCAGIGAALAMCCDQMVMADDAYIYQAFAAIGLIPDGGSSWHLVNTLGYKRALEFVIGATKIPAQDCLDYGLCNKVVPAAELMHEARSWAENLAIGSPLAQKYSKQVLKAAQRLSLSEVIDLEAKTQNKTFASEDFENAKNAFLNKKKPTFAGR